MKSHTEPQHEKRMFKFDIAKWASCKASEKSTLKTIHMALFSFVVTDSETCASPRIFSHQSSQYFLFCLHLIFCC